MTHCDVCGKSLSLIHILFIVRFTTGETYAVNASEVNEAVKQLGNYLEGKDVKVN